MSATPEELAMVDAFIDKELDGPDAERVAHLLEERVDLRDYADQQQCLKARLDAAFLDVAAADVPASLVETARRAPMPAVGTRMARASLALAAWRTLPIAAAVILSLGLGLYLGSSTSSRSLIGTGADGTLSADGALAAALTTQLAADDQGQIAVGLSFRSKDNRMCRTFSTRGSKAISGIACREKHGWSIAGIAESEGAADATKFQTAGAALPDVLRDRVKAMIAGDVLDTAGERAARDRDWRTQ